MKLDAQFSGEIFRNDQPIIIAQNRHLATIQPVRLAYSATDYIAGTVLARNTTSGFYERYNDAGSSGLDTAAGILFESHFTVEFASSGDTQAARCIFGGEVFKAKLTGLDSNAETDLKARTITDATGIVVLKF